MSVAHTVILPASDVPTAGRLNEALRRAGFDLQLEDGGESLDGSVGSWPATHRGKPVGFEVHVQPVSEVELPARWRGRLGHRDRAVSFVTGSSERDLNAAVVTACVLAATSRGGLLYVEASGDVVEHAPELLALARASDVDTPDAPPAPAPVAYPYVSETSLEVRERRRSGHALRLEGGTAQFVLYLRTAPLAAPVVATVKRLVVLGPSTQQVMTLDVAGRVVELSPKGRVLDPELALDYDALCKTLGDTESVTQALLAGERPAAAALTRFVADERADLARRRLGVVTLGLLGADAVDGRAVLAELRSHPTLGRDAHTALERIDRALA